MIRNIPLLLVLMALLSACGDGSLKARLDVPEGDLPVDQNGADPNANPDDEVEESTLPAAISMGTLIPVEVQAGDRFDLEVMLTNAGDTDLTDYAASVAWTPADAIMLRREGTATIDSVNIPAGQTTRVKWSAEAVAAASIEVFFRATSPNGGSLTLSRMLESL